MESTFTEELGFLSLAAQMKQVQEAMVHSARSLYKEKGLEIEPNWYLIFLLLKNEKSLAVTEISEKLGMAHPSVISIINKMKKKGFLVSVKDPSDSRKQMISLSDKATKELPEFEKIWSASTLAIKKMLNDDPTILEVLHKLRIKLDALAFMERTLNELKND